MNVKKGPAAATVSRDLTGVPAADMTEAEYEAWLAAGSPVRGPNLSGDPQSAETALRPDYQPEKYDADGKPRADFQPTRFIDRQSAETALSAEEVTEYAVWFARKSRGSAAEVAARLLEQFPALREPLEAAALPASTESGSRLDDLRRSIVAALEEPGVRGHGRRLLELALQRDALAPQALRAEGCTDPEHPLGAFCTSTTGLPYCTFYGADPGLALRSSEPEAPGLSKGTTS
jgi:hypothetical protein